MKRTHRFLNMYLTAAVSVFLVLLLIGSEGILVLSTTSAIHRVQEDVAMTIVLSEEADSAAVAQMDSILRSAPYCSQYQFISRDQALEEHIQTMGDDPSTFLGYNPLFDSYEMHPVASYASPDSMARIDSCIAQLPYVHQVLYQSDLLNLIDHNVNRASIILLIVGIALLLIAMVLIINTIRLQIYSKRFIINTMTLVGATSWNIRSPFVWKNVLMGVITSLCANIVLVCVLHYFRVRFGLVLFEATWVNYACIMGLVVVAGVLITLIASLIATGRYIRMKLDKMYEI